MQPKIETPEQLIEQVGELSGQMSDVQSQLRGLLAQGGGSVAVPMEGGLAAFKTQHGLQLVRAKVDVDVAVGGRTVTVTGERPGIFDAEARSMLTEDQREAVDGYLGVLREINAVGAFGFRGKPVDQMAQLIQRAKAAPPELRGTLSAHADSVVGAYSARERDGQWASTILASRKAAAFASSSANSSGNPGYSWVADDYLPEVVDSTTQAVGLYDMMIASAGGAGLHPTAAIKLRVMTRTGGGAIINRQTTDTLAGHPRTNVGTEVLELTGGRAVHSSIIDGPNLRDPREAVDWLALHRGAGATVIKAIADYNLIHGHKVAGAASHQYAAAGLASIILEHRDATYSGGDLDPMLLSDGITRMAIAASSKKDLATSLGVSASAVLGTQANAVAAHRAMRALLDEQYRNGAVIITTTAIADAMVALGIGVAGRPFATPATMEQKARNPWLLAELYDGTPVMGHIGVTSGWNSSGLIASGGSLGAMLYVNPAVLRDVRGESHGRVDVVPQPDGDKTIVTTYYSRAPMLAVESTRKAMALAYNLSV